MRCDQRSLGVPHGVQRSLLLPPSGSLRGMQGRDRATATDGRVYTCNGKTYARYEKQ